MANNSYRYNSTGVGIHRVTRQPFDDKTVFYNPIDLLIYSKAGARYNGQQASLIYNNKQIDVIINNDQPILKFNNIEYYTKYNDKYYVLLYYYNPFFNDRDTDMHDNIMKYKDNTISIDNPNRFNIINLMNIFRGNELEGAINEEISNNAEILINYNEYHNNQDDNFYEKSFDHEFMFVRIGLDKNLNEIKNNIVFTQKEYPFNNYTESLNNSTYFIKVIDDENDYTYFNCNIYEESTNTNENFILFPKNNDSKNLNDNAYGSDGYVTALYMEANDYVKSMLGEVI